MIKKTTPYKKGFTLLEVILYLAIVSTLVFGIGSFVEIVSASRVKSQTMTEVDQQALQIISSITETIRNAESVSTPLLGQEEQSLTVLDSIGTPTTIGLDGQRIIINRGSGVVQLSNNRVSIDSLAFKNLSRVDTPTIIQITITLSYNNTSGNHLYNYSKTYVASSGLFK